MVLLLLLMLSAVVALAKVNSAASALHSLVSKYL